MWSWGLDPLQQAVYDSLDGVGQYFINFLLIGLQDFLVVLIGGVGRVAVVPSFLSIDVYNANAQVMQTHLGINIAGNADLSWLGNLHKYMIWIAPCAMICILLTRIIQNLVDIGSGDSEYIPMSAIFARALKSCVMIALLPFIAQTIIEISAWFTSAVIKEVADPTVLQIQDVLAGGFTNNLVATFDTLGLMILLVVVYFATAVFLVAYFMKLAKYQIDMLVMFLAIIPAGISLCTDSGDFYNTWKSVFINLLITQFYTIFIFAIFISSLLGHFGAMSFVFGFGSLICMFKQPELIKRIGYSSSGVRRSSMAAVRLLASAIVKA